MTETLKQFWREHKFARYKYEVIDQQIVRTGILGYSRAIVRECDGIVLATLNRVGVLTVFPEYAWDGMTCAFDTDDTMRASLFHDVLTQMIREGLSMRERPAIDALFYRIIIEDIGTLAAGLKGRIVYHAKCFRARSYWAAVRMFGWLWCQPKGKKVS